jgi:uncharacterized protein (TIGR00661 family)
MRILYGVVGEGMGHAMRSRVLLDDLTKDHEVQIIASNRAHDYLKARFEGVSRIWGLTIAYEDNEVQKRATAWQNLKGALSGWPENIGRFLDLAGSFHPDVVVTDFETLSWLYGMVHGIPVVSFDNMQIINRCWHDDALLGDYKNDFLFTKAIVKAKVPGCAQYLITSFFRPRVKKERTALVPPVLRPEILAAKKNVRRGDHLLVYATTDAQAELPRTLAAAGMECRVYGVRRGIKEEQVEGNLRFKPFSEDGFIEDLATARAVVAGGGFTLMGEAVYLGKPMLSVPVRGQFEQVLNALYLQEAGYGRLAESLTPESVKAFLDDVPRHEDALSRYTQDGNVEAIASLRYALDAVR